MADRKQISKRVVTLRHSDSPLTSKRVSLMLSNPKDSAKLADAVRALRHQEKSSFKVSKTTEDNILRESQKLASA